MIETKLIRGQIILKERDFQRLYSKGFGEKTGKLFILNSNETLYLLEKGKINVLDFRQKSIGFEELLKKLKVDYNKYLVFSDLVRKGNKVKSALKYGFDFRVYEKGTNIKNGHSKWLVIIKKSTDNINLTDFAAKIRVAHSSKKNVLIACVDSQKDITYFESNWKKI